MRRCPQCDSPLFRARFGEVTLDGCKSCGGIFFDGGELATLGRERPESLRDADRAFRPGMQPAMASTRTDACPSCTDAKLAAGEHPSFPGIAMRMCTRCKGVFLDHGGALALADRIAPRASVETPVAVVPSPSPSHETSTAGLPVVRGELVGRDVYTGSGLVASFERGLRFFRSALSLARECPKLLVPIYAGIGVNLLLVLGLAGAVLVALPDGVLSDRAALDAWLAERKVLVVAVALGAGLVGQLVSQAAMGTTVSAVDAHLKGRPPQLAVAFRDVLKNAGGIVALAVVSFLVELVVGALRGRRGRRNLIGSMLARAVEAAWTVLAFLLLPVIMIEDVGLLAALRRVREIHRNNLLTIAVSEVGIRLVLGLLGLALFAVLALVVYAATPTSATALAITIGVFGVAIVVLNGFSTYLRATYYTCLYLWAVAIEREPGADRVLVPAPLATALS